MNQLLQTYSLSEVIGFAVMMAIAIKSFITFWDWAVERLKKFFDEGYKTEKEKEDIEARFNRGSETMQRLDNSQKELADAIKKLAEKVDDLIESDRDRIKSDLTKDHHFFCYQKGWIDDYSLECCEKEYSHYVKEGGNSFIEGFMEELRRLPKQP